VGELARTVTDLYAFVRVEFAPLTPGLAGLMLLVTAGVAGAAAYFPALDAARTPPRLVGIESREEARYRARLPRLIVWGAAALGLGVVAMVWPAASWWPGVAAAFLFLMAGAAFLPVFMAVVLPAVTRAGERLGLVRLPLAAGALLRSLTRTGGAAAALGVALAMTVAIIVMVASYRREVNQWIESVLLADLYVSDLADAVGGRSGRIPDEAIARIAAHPGVRGVERKRYVELPYADRSLLMNGTDLPLAESTRRFTLLQGDRATVFDRVRAGAVIVSEPVANRYGLGVGDTLRVPGRRGIVSFEIAGVFRDFSVDRGYVMTETRPFLEAFGDPGVRTLSVYLAPGADAARVAGELRRSFAGRFSLQVRSHAELKSHVFDVFDSTFALTYALQVIATVMALAGIAVTLVGLFLERGREVATLRALGASVGGLAGLFACESLLLAAFPVVAAFPVGAVLAWILIHVVNLRSFGWTIGMIWPWGPVLATCALAGVAGLAAIGIPWRLARRQSIAMALREE